jgi:putative salt-induced outer membrane protein
MPDVPKPAAPGKGWDTAAGVGFGLTRGNSETLTATVNLNTAYRGAANEFFFDALAAYGETGSETTVQSVRAAVQFNHILADPFYIGERVGFLHDEIAEVDYRVTPAVVGGIYLVKNDAVKLSLEAGPAYTFERLAGVDDNYFTVLAGQKLDYKFNDTVSLKEFVTGTLDTDNTDKWVISAGASLNIVLTGRLMLQTSVIASYDNLPARGVQHGDVLLTSGLAFKF